jgi:hypothetical protein
MHQTTVRFGVDLWDSLERECERLGVSVAQYVRDSALSRLSYAAGQRGDAGPYAVPACGLAPALSEPADPSLPARTESLAEVEDSSALWAQARQARRRAQELRARPTVRE